ncbi:MAG: hypothetical protein Ta2G_11060 [Termitinemataceae bacterium]|nr:MAG: hypothetical protein Ta2G_11060 [Termitinemataceae bacterium]
MNDYKTRITQKLLKKFSQNTIDIDEYEDMLSKINNIGDSDELALIEKEIEQDEINRRIMSLEENDQNHVSIFSYRSTSVRPLDSDAGKYSSILGATRINIDERDLHGKRTIINVNSILGLTEIFVPKNIKIINKVKPFLSGVFIRDEDYFNERGTSSVNNNDDTNAHELYIFGSAVLGNVTIVRT